MKTILLLSALIFFGFTAAPLATYAQTDKPAPKSIAEPQSDDPNALLQSGVSLYRERKYDEALAHFAKAARLSPQSFRPHILIGLAYQAQLKMKSASEAYAKAIELGAKDKQLYLLKAAVDSQRRATEEALAACKKALEIDPSYTEAYALIGETLRWDEARRNEAIAAYQAALKINPRFLTAYQPLAELLAQNNDAKGAEEVFKQGIAADPQKMNGRFAFGRMLVKQGRLAEAREVWNGRTSDEDHTFPNFIVLLERAEKLKRATEALAQKPNDPAALVDMGLAVMDGDSWVMDRRQEKAMAYFQQALKLNPNYARAHYGVCKANIEMAQSPGSKTDKKMVDTELEKLRKLDPALAKELEEYRKTGGNGLPAGKPIDFNK